MSIAVDRNGRRMRSTMFEGILAFVAVVVFLGLAFWLKWEDITRLHSLFWRFKNEVDREKQEKGSAK